MVTGTLESCALEHRIAGPVGCEARARTYKTMTQSLIYSPYTSSTLVYGDVNW